MTPVSHDPRQCREALVRSAGPVVIDLETTGLRRTNQIVSAGLLVDGIAYILFVRSAHVSIRNLDIAEVRQALEPLSERKDLVVIAHNALFDLGFLLREGIRVASKVHDTLKLLRLLDQDRGGERDASARRKPRRDLRAGADAPYLLDYRLKHVAAQLFNIKMPSFPGNIALAPYEQHATYLACDLAGTLQLHEYLWARLTASEREYYEQIVAPLLPILLDMSTTGIAAAPRFIEDETARLEALRLQLKAEHERLYRVSLGMDQEQLSAWLFKDLKLPVLRWKRRGRTRVPSLDRRALAELENSTADERTRKSLQIIQSYREATSLLVRLRSLPKRIDRQTGRIHSSFDDRQSSGRVSSTSPNLQQLAKAKKISGEEILTRNALRASNGYELVVFDIAQADIRALAHAVESFPSTARDYLRELARQHRERLPAEVRDFYNQMLAQTNPDFVGQPSSESDFDPNMAPDLAADFSREEDFYTSAASRFLGRAPRDKTERNRYKAIILSIVNGLGAPSLARTLECSAAEAKRFLEQFDRVFPKVAAYKRLMYRQIAWTGQTTTFMGRPRTVTAHRWLVTEPRVEMLVSYRGGDAYWLDVVPLRPSLRVLTTFVRRAWNARSEQRLLIYDSERGRLGRYPYSMFQSDDLQYRLPLRNWGWRSIRRIRNLERGEEASYEGFDATARSAFNFICQGGTADICKLMMIRSQPICAQYGARLLIQIHDELVFEAPTDKADAFLRAMYEELQRPPTPDFEVPIVVEAKRGFSFGALEGVNVEV